ncbi:MAG: methylmalonyl Co-A mutase-associated GTPase MeaB [Candidatus Binatus sp.]|uniref:methylmalonyl Co-A mutase-associated GTPase MeaB n=1 Tax=Candidatus Binatus sp. TaxID=2811406 RepID=UPI0027285FFC|nr:methylmalonyl Co-A mutase-associated GTPase MeaB [Candidatus Binatus sp.]MDO8431744.1 methylmalonyl Co-A mutase-associated GTPase MeaB [Candidatus Binatus sp.]
MTSDSLPNPAAAPQPEGTDLNAMLARFERGDLRIRDLARLITKVENRSADSSTIIERIYAKTGHAQVVGITGPPGAGKSTLINRLIALYRGLGKKIAILAIDPSSPFSGGAVLGDRVRMTDHYKDEGVYIRSLSSRGSHGGLSRAAREIVKLLDAFGNDVIIIETVGVGQTELAIMDLADTTVVVTVPEGGDSVQMMKAGLNEIADIFVVNKADREGADRIKAELELSVHLRGGDGWRAPVLLTQAAADRGVDKVVEAIAEHREYLREHTDAAREADRRTREFVEVLSAELEERAIRTVADGGVSDVVSEVRRGKLNPYSAVRRIIEDRSSLDELLLNGKSNRRGGSR